MRPYFFGSLRVSLKALLAQKSKRCFTAALFVISMINKLCKKPFMLVIEIDMSSVMMYYLGKMRTSANKGFMMISLNLFRLKAQLEGKKEKRYTIAEMSEKTGLHRNTVRGLLNGKTRRIDLDVLGSLFAFFRQEGLEIEIADLFKMDTQPAK